MKLISIVFALVLLLTPEVCLALAKVILIDKEQRMAAIDQPEDFKWQVEDYVCVSSGRTRIGCGQVTKVTGKGAILKLDYWTDSKIKVGDKAMLSPGGPPGGRGTASKASGPSTSETSAPERLAGDTPILPNVPTEPSGSTTLGAPPGGTTPSTGSTAGSNAAKKAADASGDEVAKDLEKLNDPNAVETPAVAAESTPVPIDPKLEALQNPTAAPEAEGEAPVNLEAMDETPATPAAAAAAAGSPSSEEPTPPSAIQGHVRTAVKPRFRALFDLLFTYRPGLVPAVTFDTYHSLLMFEFVPNPSIFFGFEVSPSPRYFELDYKFSPSLVLRMGRIYIPFDDLGPHSYFGGRANVSRLVPVGSSAFLPTLWADLGIGLQVGLYSSRDTTLTWDFYVVNGFGEGLGNNPSPTFPNGIYPDFSQTSPIQDNNKDKGIGTRLAGKFFTERLGLGVSMYRDRYSNEANPKAGIFMLGVDTQLKFSSTELRAGFVYMGVDLIGQETSSYARGGFYTEFVQDLNYRGTWKIVLRSGVQNFDSRFLTNGDLLLGGAALVHRAGPVTLSFEYSEDLNRLSTKTNFTYVAWRATAAL